MRPVLAAVLLLLAANAAAQPGPSGGPPPRFGQPDAPPPDLGRLAAEVRARPTDARSVNPRYGALMAALDAAGLPPDAQTDRRINEIRRLLGAGKLTPAARALDRAVAEVVARKDAPAGAPLVAPAAASAPAAALAAAAALPAPVGPEFTALAPAMLSTPELPRAALPAAPSGAAAEPRLTEPVAAVYAAKPAPASSGPPWRFIAGVAGVAAFVGAGLLLAAARRVNAVGGGASAAGPSDSSTKALAEKYSLGRVVASGGMGEVYEGRDLTLGRRVAIKRLLPDIKLDAAMRGQFLKEARTVAKLSHPYIIPIHDCLESDGDLYLVFEFVDGETLDRRLTREARLPLKECKRIFGYVCAAVAHAHDHHVLHRDLKPANIMLDAGGIARVMDFGIALDSTRTMTSAAPGLLDASGTLRYMPPEQHYGKSVRASDVYAMGVCLYEMATGHPPFAAGTVDQLIEAKRNRRYPAPSALYPELPKEFDLFVAAVLAPDPQKRVSSAPEFLDLLGGVPA